MGSSFDRAVRTVVHAARGFIGSAVAAAFLVACTSPDEVPAVEQESYIHIRPAWSPDGTTIAFTSQAAGQVGIWLVDTSGANLRLLHAGDAVGASWSPDGKWVAFSQGNQIYAHQVQNDSVKLLVSVAPAIQPAWSPDGTRLAFLRSSSGSPSIVVRTFADSTELDLQLNGQSVGWLHGGREIFYASEQTLAPSVIRYTFLAATTGPVALSVLFSLDRSVPCRWFRLDSLHNVLVYETDPSRHRTQIEAYDAIGGGTTSLTTDGGADPAVCPDGSLIAYANTSPAEGGIWVMRTDGTEKRRLTKP